MYLKYLSKMADNNNPLKITNFTKNEQDEYYEEEYYDLYFEYGGKNVGDMVNLITLRTYFTVGKKMLQNIINLDFGKNKSLTMEGDDGTSNGMYFSFIVEKEWSTMSVDSKCGGSVVELIMPTILLINELCAKIPNLCCAMDIKPAKNNKK